MLSNGIAQGCILWEFYEDPKDFLWRFYIDFYRPNKSHLPFKDPGSIGMSTGPLHMDLHWDYLKIVVRIQKELIGFPRIYIRIRLGIL